MDVIVTIGKQGRVVIPAELRTALGLVAGDRLNAHLSGRRLVLEQTQDAVSQLRSLGAGVPVERSLVDELLAERQLAALAE